MSIATQEAQLYEQKVECEGKDVGRFDILKNYCSEMRKCTVGGARGVGQLPLPAPTAPTLHLSRTILSKASRSATEEEDSDNFTDYLWLFRTRMPMLRRQDLL
jgi:hypothetical protein